MENMFIVIVLVARALAAATALTLCTVSEDCGPQQFCHFPTDSCAPCIDCSLYHRVGKTVTTDCFKDPQECGDCIEGFMDEFLGDGTVRPLCVPLNRSNYEPMPLAVTVPVVTQTVIEANMWVLYFLGVVGILLIAAFVVKIVSKRPLLIKVRGHAVPNRPTDCEVSNLYAPSAPAHPSYHGGEAEICKEVSYFNRISECTDDLRQQASKYLDPQYVRSPSMIIPDSDAGPNDEVDSHDSPNETLLFDENTLPSNWSPGPDYVNPPLQGLPTTFAGVLSLNASATSSEPVNHTAITNCPSASQTVVVTAVNGQASTGVMNF